MSANNSSRNHRWTLFISYRRKGVPPYAPTLLRDRLCEKYSRVFLDTESIMDGDAWRNRIDEGLRNCAVFLALIGDGWETGGEERCRLNDRGDMVRYEIEQAMKRNYHREPKVDLPIWAIPVLVDREDKPMGPFDSEDINTLLREIHGAATLRHDRIGDDIKALSTRIDHGLRCVLNIQPLGQNKRWIKFEEVRVTVQCDGGPLSLDLSLETEKDWAIKMAKLHTDWLRLYMAVQVVKRELRGMFRRAASVRKWRSEKAILLGEEGEEYAKRTDELDRNIEGGKAAIRQAALEKEVWLRQRLSLSDMGKAIKEDPIAFRLSSLHVCLTAIRNCLDSPSEMMVDDAITMVGYLEKWLLTAESQIGQLSDKINLLQQLPKDCEAGTACPTRRLIWN